MRVTFNEEEKRLTISDCPFDAVEIFKGGIFVTDIPLKDGEGFWVNQDLISLDDNIALYPYNVIEIDKLEIEQEL